MISRTHILESVGLSDVFDEGDIIKFEFEAPSHLRASSIPKLQSSGQLQFSSYVTMAGVLRPSDNVLYLFTYIKGGIIDTAGNMDFYIAKKNSLSNIWLEVIVPEKISVCTNTSSTEIDMASVINNNIIGQYARGLLKEGTKKTIVQSIIFDKHLSYKPDDDYWISKANWTNIGSYRNNYLRYKVTFNNVDTLEYVPQSPHQTGYFTPVKPTKPVIVEGYQVSRNVLK
nr:MAG TPA: hypothetical protein [Caudoviricetes sp.]